MQDKVYVTKRGNVTSIYLRQQTGTVLLAGWRGRIKDFTAAKRLGIIAKIFDNLRVFGYDPQAASTLFKAALGRQA